MAGTKYTHFYAASKVFKILGSPGNFCSQLVKENLQESPLSALGPGAAGDVTVTSSLSQVARTQLPGTQRHRWASRGPAPLGLTPTPACSASRFRKSCVHTATPTSLCTIHAFCMATPDSEKRLVTFQPGSRRAHFTMQPEFLRSQALFTSCAGSNHTGTSRANGDSITSVWLVGEHEVPSLS